MPLHKWTRRVILAVFLNCATSLCAAAENLSETDQVKAAFFMNFALYTYWPSDLEQDRPVSLCAFDQKFTDFLQTLIDQRRPGQGKPLNSMMNPDDLAAQCQAIYIADPARIAALIAELPPGILVVSDNPDGLADGVAVNLYIEQGRVNFEINNSALMQSGLSVSSDLLRLAKRRR